MVKIYNRLRLLLMLLMCGLFCYPSSTVFTQGKQDSKIVFLHLRMKDGVITLVNTAIRSGHLKPQPTSGVKGDILYEVSDVSGTSLWQGVCNNHSHRRYEYEDPDNPGKILTKIVEQNDVKFTIRIPYDPAIKTISFYSLNESIESLKSKQPSSMFISKIDLQLDKTEGRQ